MVCPSPSSDTHAVANSAVETEGLAKMARAMGIQPWGMPAVHVSHH